MSSTYTALRDSVEAVLSDSSNAVYTTAELDVAISEGLKDIADIRPNIELVEYTVESRYGTASATTASALVDTTKAQFLSTDVDKVIYNSTDKTWAVVTAYVSTSQLTISKDIMASGESYYMFNKRCTASNQINIEDVTDYLGIIRIEYPIGNRVSWDASRGDIIELKLDYTPDDSNVTGSDKDVYVYFKKRHKLSQLTDLAGAVNNAGGYAAASTSMAINGLQVSGTIEADQEFTIVGTRGTYTVTADATIAANAATISFYPGLQSAVINGAVINFKLSTLKPQDEQILIAYSAGKAAVAKANALYNEGYSSIAIIATITTSLGNTAARITQAVTDVSSGRTELAKTVAVVLEANSAIDTETARIGQAVTDIASGRTASGKIDALITAGATPLAAVAAQLTLAIGDLASGRTAAGKIDAIISSANTEIGLMNAQVDLAVTALASGASILNTVPVGGGAVEYMSQANTDINTAQGYLSDAQGYLAQASADHVANNSYLGLARGEVQAAIGKIQEASGFFAQARADEGASSSYQGLAVRELNSAGEYLNQARGYLSQVASDININTGYLQTAVGELRASGEYISQAIGYMRQIGSKVSIAQAGRLLQQWGEAKMAIAKQQLRVISKPRVKVVWSRN